MVAPASMVEVLAAELLAKVMVVVHSAVVVDAASEAAATAVAESQLVVSA